MMTFDRSNELFSTCLSALKEKKTIRYSIIDEAGIITKVDSLGEEDFDLCMIFTGIKDGNKNEEIICSFSFEDNIADVAYNIKTNTIFFNRVKTDNTVYVYELLIDKDNKPCLNTVDRINTANNNFESKTELVSFMNKFFHVKDFLVEHGYLLAFSDTGSLKAVIHVSQGNSMGCSAPIREIFIALLLLNSRLFYFVHNHPEGNVYPSKDDINTTNKLVEAAALLGMDFDDHIIIGKDGYYSFKEEEDVGCKVD